MRLGPVVALLHVHPIANVLAALDLRRTDPLPVHTMWEPFAVEDGASLLGVDVPDAWTYAIVGASIGGKLRCCTKLDCCTGLQVWWEVIVFLQESLTMFQQGEG